MDGSYLVTIQKAEDYMEDLSNFSDPILNFQLFFFILGSVSACQIIFLKLVIIIVYLMRLDLQFKFILKVVTLKY